MREHHRIWKKTISSRCGPDYEYHGALWTISYLQGINSHSIDNEKDAAGNLLDFSRTSRTCPRVSISDDGFRSRSYRYNEVAARAPKLRRSTSKCSIVKNDR